MIISYRSIVSTGETLTQLNLYWIVLSVIQDVLEKTESNFDTFIPGIKQTTTSSFCDHFLPDLLPV